MFPYHSCNIYETWRCKEIGGLKSSYWGKMDKIHYRGVDWAIPEKIWLMIYFLKKPTKTFRFVTLPLKILEKTFFHPWKFCKIEWYTLELPRSKTKTNWPLEFPQALSSITLESPCPQPSLFCPPVLIFSGIAHFYDGGIKNSPGNGSWPIN